MSRVFGLLVLVLLMGLLVYLPAGSGSGAPLSMLLGFLLLVGFVLENVLPDPRQAVVSRHVLVTIDISLIVPCNELVLKSVPVDPYRNRADRKDDKP